MKVSIAVATIAAAMLPGIAHAQCSDGSPPPCDVKRGVTLTAVRREPPAQADRARRYLVLPFRNVTRAADQEWLVEGSTTLLAEALGRWQGITVVGDEKLYPALKRAGIASGTVADPAKVRRVAEETGGWTVVTGEVLATGGRTSITARATDVPTNRELVRATIQVATGGDVRAAFDTLSIRLLRTVGIDSTASSVSPASTRNVDAYRAYLRGLAHQRRSDIKAANSDFQEAIKLDSGFALAWSGLAEVSVTMDPSEILSGQSPSARYVAKAVALSANLPDRDRQRLLARDAFYRAQFSEARRILEALVAKDSNDVESLVALAGMEGFDPILVPVRGGFRPRANLNRGARLLKRAAELDPSRTMILAQLAGIYVTAGIPGAQGSYAVDKEPTSFQDLMQTAQTPGHLRTYVHLLGDSIILVPTESLPSIPKDSLKALQKRARAAAIGWGGRWVSVAGDDAVPHALLSQLYGLDRDFPNALKSLAKAESIGVKLPNFSGPGTRMQYLGKSGDLKSAARIADSLTTAGYFNDFPAVLSNMEFASWAFALHLAMGKPVQAGKVLERMTALRKAYYPAAAPEFTAFAIVMGNGDPDDEPGITRTVRQMQLDTIVSHIGAMAKDTVVGPWLSMALPMIAEAVDTTLKKLPMVIDAAATLATDGNTDLAFQLASNAVSSDSTLEACAATYAWYRPGAEAYNTMKRGTIARFKPASATVGADKVVFEWTVNDTAPFLRNRPETPVGRGEYRWEQRVVLGDRYYRIYAASRARIPGPVASGTIQEVLPFSSARVIVTGKFVNGVEKDTTAVRGVSVRSEFAPGVLRFIISDKGLVDQLRAAKPAEATFRFFPCIRPVGSTAKLECLEQAVKFTYSP